MPVDARNDITRAERISKVHGVNNKRTCRICGCNEFDACYHEDHGNCWWVAPDLCSHCHLWPGEAQRWSEINDEPKSDLE